MSKEEIEKRLWEFSEYLDTLKPSLNKGKLMKFWGGYLECYNLVYKLENIKKEC